MPDTLSVCNLSASYGGVPVLKNVSLCIRSGEVVCLTGPNGSGKSTLLSLLAGITGDRLHIDSADQMPQFSGMDVMKADRRETARHIAYMVQDEQCAWNYTVRDIVLTGRYPRSSGGHYTQSDYDAADRIMIRLGIALLAGRHVFTLSGGEMQKVRIARALAQEPDMLLLDEPVANLDFSYQSDLLAVISEIAYTDGTGVLISIHDLNTAARFADRIALLPPLCPCITDTVPKVFTPEILYSVYGTRFGIFTHPAYGCPQVYTE